MYLLVLGANSDTAHALAARFAQEERAHLYLASRDRELLEKRARDLALRHQVEVRPLVFDATDYASHAAFYAGLDPKPDGVALAFGYLGDQQEAQQNFGEAKKIIDVNFTGAVSILEIVAADFARRNHGFIIALSSVAGERGRQSNYIYGAAKGALTTYLSGLRHRLCPHQVRVMTVLPGFMATKMTEHLKLPGPLTASPEEAAGHIFRAYKKGRDVVYIKPLWRWIMMLIRNLPEFVFKRTKL
ncbi:MAG: SDR family oxidoreductase [Deltaproteobacteria bacterium]|nr:SDR family oxidoreductase [Deltaproteobacteria bacterium]